MESSANYLKYITCVCLVCMLIAFNITFFYKADNLFTEWNGCNKELCFISSRLEESKTPNPHKPFISVPLQLFFHD